MGDITSSQRFSDGIGRLDPTQAGVHGNKTDAPKAEESYVAKYGKIKHEIKDSYSNQTGRIDKFTDERLSEIKALKQEGNLTPAQKKMLSNYKKETLQEAKDTKREIKAEYKEIKKDLKHSKSLAKTVDKSLDTMNRLFKPVGDDKPERIIGGAVREMADKNLVNVSNKALSSIDQKMKNFDAMKKVSIQELMHVAKEKEKEIDTEIDSAKLLHKELSEKYKSTEFSNSSNKAVVKEVLDKLDSHIDKLENLKAGNSDYSLKDIKMVIGDAEKIIKDILVKDKGLQDLSIAAQSPQEIQQDHSTEREKETSTSGVDKFRNIEKMILFGAEYEAEEIKSAGTESDVSTEEDVVMSGGSESEILVEDEEMISGEGEGSISASARQSVKPPIDDSVKPFDLGADLSARFANFDIKPEAKSTRADQKDKINKITEDALEKLEKTNSKDKLTPAQKKMMSNFKTEMMQETKSAKKAVKNAEDFESVAKQKGEALEKTAGNFTRNLKIAGKVHKTIEEATRLHKQLSDEIASKEFESPRNKAAAESGLARLEMQTAKLKELEKAVKKAGSDRVEINYQLYSDIEVTKKYINEVLAQDKPATIAGQYREALGKAQKAYDEMEADFENKTFKDEEKPAVEAKLKEFKGKIDELVKAEHVLKLRAPVAPLSADEFDAYQGGLEVIKKEALDIEVSVGELMKKGVDKKISRFDRLIQGKSEHEPHVYAEKARARAPFAYKPVSGANFEKAASFEETGGVKALHSMREITKRIIENRDKLDIELLTYGSMPLDKNSPAYKAYNDLIVASDRVKARINPIAERLAQIQPDENGKVDRAEIESLIKELASFYLSDEFTDLVRVFSQAGNLVLSEELDSGHSSIPEGRTTSPQTAYAHSYQGMTRLVMPLKELLSEIPEGNTALFKTLENAFARTEELGYITNENIGNSKPLPFENYRTPPTTEEGI